ncbi:MAG: histidine kinase [Caulobacteraceae bacterium]
MALQTLAIAPSRFDPMVNRLVSLAGRAWRSDAGRRLAWTVFVWAIAYVTITISSIRGDAPHELEFAARRVVVCLAGVAMSWAAITLTESRALSLKARLVSTIIISVPLAIIYGLTNDLVFSPLIKYIWLPSGRLENIIEVSSGMYFVFIAAAIAHFMVVYAISSTEKDIALSEARRYSLEIQNKMLMYQVRPHFLFNTLNALSTLVLERRNEDAEKMIIYLSTFLRSSLEQNSNAKISLSRELDVQRQYLAIEMIRFSDRMLVEEDIPSNLLDTLVPSLILQPIIENAVKYAVAPSPSPVTIWLQARAIGDRLRIRVADTGSASPPPDTPRLGIGLGNVKARLELSYGRAATLQAASRPGGGFLVTLILPLERP